MLVEASESASPTAAPSPAAMPSGNDISDYERERLARMARNAEYLRTLGLAMAKEREIIEQEHSLQHMEQEKKRAKEAKKETPQELLDPALRSRMSINKFTKTTAAISAAAVEAVSAHRQSRRLRGELPDIVGTDPESNGLDDTYHNSRGYFTRCLWRGKKRSIDFFDGYTVPEDVHVPLTLGSIVTTVWELGSIYTGPGKENYWSGRSSLHKHPYPVGYRATKFHFNTCFTMEIQFNGPEGPLFVVTDESGHKWTGETATSPWNYICKRSKSNGTRISGPLFYGFSDPILQKLLQKLPNYEPYSEIQKIIQGNKQRALDERKRKQEEVQHERAKSLQFVGDATVVEQPLCQSDGIESRGTISEDVTSVEALTSVKHIPEHESDSTSANNNLDAAMAVS